MSNSPLATYTRITKNKTSPRNHTIDTITIHCIVGQWTAKQGCDYFATTDRQCSANYVVGKDGSIGLSVDEKDRSWCSSNSANDNRAITIEVASDTTHPYAVTDAAFAALLNLVEDICRRNGIKKLVWSTNKNDRVNHLNGCNMTVHRDYANKACPGDYLYNRHGEIAAEVNRRPQGASSGGGVVVTPPSAEKPADSGTGATATPYLVRVTISDLYIRKGPGTNYGKNGFIKPGVYTIVEESTGTGATKWGKLKSGAGWISLDYANKACPGDYLYNRHGEIAAEVNRRPQGASSGGGVVVTPPSAEKPADSGTGATATPYLVRVTISDLYIRKGPGTNYGKNGFIKPGVYTIVEESTGTGATKWGKLKSGAGWISLDYAKRV